MRTLLRFRNAFGDSEPSPARRLLLVVSREWPESTAARKSSDALGYLEASQARASALFVELACQALQCVTLDILENAIGPFDELRWMPEVRRGSRQRSHVVSGTAKSDSGFARLNL